MLHRPDPLTPSSALLTSCPRAPPRPLSLALSLSPVLPVLSFSANQAEYGDTSTLPARINRHCLLLATRKTASNQSAAAAVAPNNVAACGTTSPPLPLPPPPAATASASANPSLFSNSLHPRGGVFIQQAEEDGGNWAVAQPASGLETGVVLGWQGGRGGASGTHVEKAVQGREGGALLEASSHGEGYGTMCVCVTSHECQYVVWRREMYV